MNESRVYLIKDIQRFRPYPWLENVLVTVIKTKAGIRFPGPSRVRKELYLLTDYQAKTITLYWNGKRFISERVYRAPERRRLKRQAEIQAELTAKATVQDVLNFVRESRRNSVNCDVKSNMKAGQNTSEGRELLDRCDRGGEAK